ESRVVVPFDTSVEEFEVEGLEVQLRSSRDRIPTPHVSTEMLEEAFPNSGKSVRIFPVAEMQAIATSGQTRSSRERQATPFFKDEDFDVHEGGRSVNFDDTISTEAVLVEPQAGTRPVRDRISTPFTSMAFSSFQDRRVQLSPAPTAVEEFEPASQRLRPSRDRMPTPHVSTSMIEETFANFSKTVRLFPAAETEVIHLDGQRRPVRERQATPFFKEDSDLDSKAVEFSDKVSWETPSKVVAAPQSKVGRSVRDRVATPFVAEAQEFEDHRVLLTTVVSTVEDLYLESDWTDHNLQRAPAREEFEVVRCCAQELQLGPAWEDSDTLRDLGDAGDPQHEPREDRPSLARSRRRGYSRIRKDTVKSRPTGNPILQGGCGEYGGDAERHFGSGGRIGA
ncbi:unnamed protein product, partial [Symbiodinium necroappetens]